MVKNNNNPRRKRRRSLSPSPTTSGVSTAKSTINQYDHPHYTRQKQQSITTYHANNTKQIRTVSDSTEEQQHQEQNEPKQQEKEQSYALTTISASPSVAVSCSSLPSTTVTTTAFAGVSSHYNLLPPLPEKRKTSDYQQQQQQHENICGTCNHPLHLPPPMKNKEAKYGDSADTTHQSEEKHHGTVALPQTTTADKDDSQTQKRKEQEQLDYRIITCANYSMDSKSSKCLLRKQAKHNYNSASTLGHKSSTSTNSSPHFHLCCSGVPRNSSLYRKLVEALEKKESKRSVSPALQSQQHSSTRRQSSSSTSSSTSSSPVPFNSDPSNKDVASQFLCPACDIKGTSMYLYEYFSKIHELKVQYFNDHEALYAIQPVGYIINTGDGTRKNKSNGPQKEIKDRDDDGNDCMQGKRMGMGKDNGFVSFLIDRQQQNQQSNSNSVSLQQPYKNTELRLDHIQNILSQIPSSAGSNHSSVDPTHLLGQPIRLWCEIANCYYTGRIVASKVVGLEDLHRLKDCTKKMYKKQDFASCVNNDPTDHTMDTKSRQNILLDRDIGRTQYLIRFRAGIEGRKVAVHEWIFLEEHAITVAISLVWVNMNFCVSLGEKGTDQNFEGGSQENSAPAKFRPLQLFVRTALEMTATDEINCFPHTDDDKKCFKDNSTSSNSESIKSIGIFFSKKFQSIILPLENKNHLQTTIPALSETHNKNMENGVINKVSTVLESCIGGFLSSTKKSLISSTPAEELDGENYSKGKGGERKDADASRESQSNQASEEVFFIADFDNPPVLLKSHLGEGKSTDEILNISVSLATMEAEEQRRIRAQEQY